MNVGACERIFIENRGFRTNILQNFQAFWRNLNFWSWKLSYFLNENVCFYRGNVTFSFQWGACERTCASTGGLVNGRRGVKRGSRGPHIPVPPFQVSAPGIQMWTTFPNILHISYLKHIQMSKKQKGRHLNYYRPKDIKAFRPFCSVSIFSWQWMRISTSQDYWEEWRRKNSYKRK